MSVDPQQFRQTIGLFATGVTVISALAEDEIHAMTANAVTSLSLDPLLVLVCVDKRARMAGFLKGAPEFTISILREDQTALSTYFAGAWKEATAPPFRFVSWPGGPRLEGCLAALGCKPYQWLEGGDHWIVIGRVVSLHQGITPHKPLLFYGGRYGRLDVRRTTPAPDWGLVEIPVQAFYDPWRRDDM